MTLTQRPRCLPQWTACCTPTGCVGAPVAPRPPSAEPSSHPTGVRHVPGTGTDDVQSLCAGLLLTDLLTRRLAQRLCPVYYVEFLLIVDS